MAIEKRVFHAEKRSWLICEEFQCIYGDDPDCRMVRDVKKAKVQCPIKMDYCGKAYCSHCAKFMSDKCPREHHKAAELKQPE